MSVGIYLVSDVVEHPLKPFYLICSSPATPLLPIYCPPESSLVHISITMPATDSEVPDLKPISATAAQYPPKPIEICGFEIYLTEYARDAIEMAESPVHMLIDIMYSNKDAYMRADQCKLPASI